MWQRAVYVGGMSSGFVWETRFTGLLVPQSLDSAHNIRQCVQSDGVEGLSKSRKVVCEY
jgi:hypothetical protein